MNVINMPDDNGYLTISFSLMMPWAVIAEIKYNPGGSLSFICEGVLVRIADSFILAPVTVVITICAGSSVTARDEERVGALHGEPLCRAQR